jgi:hypothetical protein
MQNEKPMLFVRKASGLRRAITPWQSLFFGIGVVLGPWYYTLMASLPYWYPGINLPALYSIAASANENEKKHAPKLIEKAIHATDRKVRVLVADSQYSSRKLKNTYTPME